MKNTKKNLLQRDFFREVMPDLLDHLKQRSIKFTEAQAHRVALKVKEMEEFQPVVAILGKTGSGKSSLSNAIFGRDAAAVSDTEACTRTPTKYIVHVAKGKSIALLDVPGVGESSVRDTEYHDLYKLLIPKVDLILWVIKADDRALAIDQSIWASCIKPYLDSGSPIFIVVNQVDKLNPVREWNVQECKPGPNQNILIHDKVRAMSAAFGLAPERVLPVSALEKYNISDLVEAIIFALPNEKKLPFVNAVADEVVSEPAKKEAKRGFIAAVSDFIKNSFEVVAPYIPTIVDILKIVLFRRK